MPPPGSNWRWEDYETGETGVMPWEQERDPTDYEIDSYRAREKYRIENGGIRGWAKSFIPDEVEDWWTERNKPHSTFMGDQIKEGYKASGGRPISIPSPLGNFSIPIPQGMGEFAGSMLDDQTSDVNLALNAATLGGYAGLSGLGGMAKGGLQTLGKVGGLGQMAQGGIGLGAGGVNMADAMTRDDSTWGDYGNAALQMGLGAFGMWGGKSDLDAFGGGPKPMTDPFAPKPGVITNPRRLLGPGPEAPPVTPGARFYGGAEGVEDLYGPLSPGRQAEITPRADVLSQQAAQASPRPPGAQFSGGIQDLTDPYIGPNGPAGAGPAGGIEIAGLGDVAPPADLPLQPPVNPRGPSAGMPFEQDPSIWQQMRQGPGGEPIDLAAHQIQDPVVPNTTMDGPGTSRPASDFWRTVVAEGQLPPTINPVSARGIEGPNIPESVPDVGRPIIPDALSQFEPVHPEWYKALEKDPELLDDIFRQADEVGIDVADYSDLDELVSAIDDATPGPKMADHAATAAQMQAEQMGTARPMDIPIESPQNVGGTGLPGPANIDAGPAATRMAPAAALPAPVAPVRDAASRVAVMPEPAPAAPLVRPAKPKGPTPDRTLRIGRGAHDTVRAIFPDKLHADLFSAFGRARKIMRGERSAIPPDYEGLAKQMGVSVKDVQRIASEYRLKVLQQAKALPEYAPEGFDTIDMEAPHWGGKPAEMVPTPPPAPPPVAAAPPASAVAPIPPPKAKPVIRSATDIKGNNRVWINDVEFTDRFGPGGPTMSEIHTLRRQAADPESFRRLAELKGEEFVDLAPPQPKSEPAAAVAAPALPAPALPKSKNARVKRVMDELTTLGTATMQDISNDPARLRSAAKAAGIKPDTLKSALQEWFKKAGGSETGALNVRLPSKKDLVEGFEKSFDAANSVRMASMLSGLAFPKSLAGNIGAHFAAALEGRTLKPLKVLANMKAIKRDLKVGWQSHANPALVQGFNKFNLPGRAMGAFDYAGIESLMRAGLSEKEAKELMLTGANAVSAWWPLQGRAGKFLVPFRTTPFNQLAQGLTRWKKHPEVYAAAALLGALAGTKVEDRETLAMVSAFAGPYALPFLVGAYVGSGRKNAEILGGISPIPDWGITKTIQNTLSNPFKLITDSPGKRWFRPGVGFGAEAKEEKRVESLERRRAKRRAAREAAEAQ